MNKQKFYGTVWNKLVKFNRQNGLIKPQDRILAAVSGGADSVCMLDFLVKLSTKKHFSVTVCHINHSLRKNTADNDEKFVKNFCKKINIEFTAKKVNTKTFAKENNLCLEHAARKLRYKALGQTAQKYKCNKIVTAHHLDDHAETIILNILRGTNIKGLTGIPLERKLTPKSKISVIRPLLCLTKKEILNYLKYCKLSFCADETNKSLKFTRNWARHKLIPFMETKQPKLKEHLFEISKQLFDLKNKF